MESHLKLKQDIISNFWLLKLLGSTKSKITKDKNGENVLYLEITEEVLIHCNVVNNSYQQNSRVLYTFAPNNSLGQSLDISPENFIFLKTFNSEFSYIEVWFTDQNSKPLETKDKINITLALNYCVTYKNGTLFSSTKRLLVKGYGFVSFAERQESGDSGCKRGSK